MADSVRQSKNRWVGWDRNVRLFIVQGGVTVRTGDLMFLDNTDDLRNDGDSTATNFAFPISYLRISGASLQLNKDEVKERFLGVATDDKDGDISSAVNVNIPIASAGKFSFDLKPAKTVNATDYFGPSGTTASSDIFDQKIAKTSRTTDALGYFTERKIQALTADVMILPAFAGVAQAI